MRRVLAACVCGTVPGAFGQAPDGFYVREGYEVSVAVADLPGARFMEFDDRARLHVSRPGGPGAITVFGPSDTTLTQAGTFVSGQESVHGLHFFDGWMWFSTATSIHRARDADGDARAEEVVDVVTGLTRANHWWRPVLVTPDGFYTSIGDNGNITDEAHTDRQKMWLYTLDGSSRRLFASGIRNNEKYRFRPGTREIWGFDHGSDWFGSKVGDGRGRQPVTDLNPPDELNLYVDGGFYGHPFIVGARLPRYEYMERDDITELAAKTIPPEWGVGAHWACNGWTFIDPGVNRRAGALPPDLEGDILVACHGSWNSSVPVGYCVARVLFDKDPSSDRAGRPYGLEKIVGCVEPGEGRSGIRARPVDVVQAPDGTVLFSSDAPGRIYRLRFAGDR